MPNQKEMSYAEKRAFYDRLLTIYGRKPVQEALNLKEISGYRLHLAESNRPGNLIREIIRLAEDRNIDIKYHSRKALSHISKNRRQDQGVALDIELPGYQPISDLEAGADVELIALENITNPQNVGMIIRAVGASPCRGVILPTRGCAKIDALVIKASAGSVLKTAIYYCDDLYSGLDMLKHKGFTLFGLSSQADEELARLETKQPTIFVLGNETTGLTMKMQALCDQLVQIPLNHHIESLNVSVTAGIVAFRSMFTRFN